MADIPPTTSASQLTAYAMCPRLYYFRYVAHIEPEFRSLNLVLGSAVHGAIGWYFEEKISGHVPTMEEVERVAAADLLSETAQATIRWKEETPETLEAKGQALVRAYLANYAEQEVVGVEQRFEVDIQDPETGEVLPRPLVGYFDLVVRKGDEIVEIKTTSRAWHPKSLLRHLQVGSYVTAAHVLHGGPARVIIHAILKQKTPRTEEYPVERGEADNGWFFHAAKAIEGAIRAGVFPPAPGPTCFECEFGNTCLAYRGEVVPAVRLAKPRNVTERARIPIAV